ncbi:unnamed protein product [Lathyrus sativus]|nr:unnamed protein product [Lathyrus sativus]
MIIGSLNIRGGGNTSKRKRISCCIKSSNTNIFFIQESKLKVADPSVIGGIWSGQDIDWASCNMSGLSGGLIILWKKEVINPLLSFRGDGFLGVKVLWKRNLYYMVNIYSPCSINLKRKLWNDLVVLKGNLSDGLWVLGGDFNVATSSSKSKGINDNYRKVEQREFSEFIKAMDLVDLPYFGNKFSWYSGDGKDMSIIDRFLISEEICNNWGVVGQTI